MIFLTDQFHKKVGFFQKNNYFFSTYMYQSDSKTSMISRVNICTTCINIFKTYNSIQCCIYSISFMNLFLIIHKTMFTCWTNILYIYTCIDNLSGLVVNPLCVWACIALSLDPTQWPTSFYGILFPITSPVYHTWLLYWGAISKELLVISVIRG